ncbi:hypothetical protein A2U01_0114748, partial [Trifolium medium]|nr:hypothetical protein [Trifolium medium]
AGYRQPVPKRSRMASANPTFRDGGSSSNKPSIVQW